MKRRIFVLFICLIISLSMLSITVWAETITNSEPLTESLIEEKESSEENIIIETEEPDDINNITNDEVFIEEEKFVETEVPDEQTDKGGIYGATFATNEGVVIDAANFPDKVFRDYLSTSFDADGDGVFSDTEIAAVTGIYVDNSEISSLKGIEFFSELASLDCNKNNLTELNVSANTALTWLDCGSNQLSELDVSANILLTELNCSINKLTELDVSKNTLLMELNCGINKLTELDISANNMLTCLNCNQNRLDSLDVSANTDLIELSFAVNLISDIDLSANTDLEILISAENNIGNLDISSNTALTCLHCVNCNLTELDVSNCPELSELYCSQNFLSELDLCNNNKLVAIECAANFLTKLDVSDCPELDCLRCSINDLTELNVSTNTALIELECNDNQLTSLDLTGLSELKYIFCDDNNLTELDIRDTQSCMSKNNYGFFGFEGNESTIKVYMTAKQKECFNAYFANEKRNNGVVVVVDKPVIISQPEDYCGVIGTTAKFKVVASGNKLNYQWQYCVPGTDVWKDSIQKGSKTDTLYVPVTKSRDGEKYRCKVTDVNGEFQYSNIATLTVKANPVNPKNDDNKQGTYSPNTGDNNLVSLCIALVLVFAAVIIFLTHKSEKLK